MKYNTGCWLRFINWVVSNSISVRWNETKIELFSRINKTENNSLTNINIILKYLECWYIYGISLENRKLMYKNYWLLTIELQANLFDEMKIDDKQCLTLWFC